jgi:alpha-ketoglutarate-dependent 2,4-dichlorophenoxyacetate dioxygenase
MVAGRKPRYSECELFDAGNIDENGNVLDPDSPRAQFGKGNALFHVDSSFNPRRASFSCLRAVDIPDPALGLGGDTQFADSRTAFEDLPSTLRHQLEKSDYVGAHTIAHSRKLGSPEFFKDLDPTTDGFSYHRLVQTHEPSGRKNLYIAAHLHHIQGLPETESHTLIRDLLLQVSDDKYTTSIPWLNKTDMIIWDNRCVLHRSGPFKGAGKFKRDLRRTTVHDDSPTAWGENKVDMGFVLPKERGDAANEAIQRTVNMILDREKEGGREVAAEA